MPWNEDTKTLTVTDYHPNTADSTNYTAYAKATLTASTSGTNLNYTITMETDISGNTQVPSVSLYLAINNSGVFNNYYSNYAAFPCKNGSTYSGSITINNATEIPIVLKICVSQDARGDNSHRWKTTSGKLTRTEAKCKIQSVSLSTEAVLKGSAVTAIPIDVEPSNATISYQWYQNNKTVISGATSATRIPTTNGEYCIVTVSYPDWPSASAQSKIVKYYARPENPTNLKITNSTGRYTTKGDYTFSWNKAANKDVHNAPENSIIGYTYNIYVAGNKIKSDTTSGVSVTYSASDLSLTKGQSMYFTVTTNASKYGSTGSATSGSVTIVSPAIVHVKQGSEWKDGTVFVNKGTNTNPTWVEATAVSVNDSVWKDAY